MRTLAVANQKGGVGKSALTVHLAHAAAEAGLRVLLVDLDRQGSLSVSFPAPPGTPDGLHASSLFGMDTPSAVPQRVTDRLSIIRADDTLSLLNGAAEQAAKRPVLHLRGLAAEFDLCLIDTPGAVGFNPPMTVAALVAADAVICPFSIGLYKTKALADLWSYLKHIKTPAYNPHLRLIVLVPSKVNTKSRKEQAALQQLREQFGVAIVPGMLAERTAVKEAIMRRRPVWFHTKGAGHLAAARECGAMCAHILGQLGVVT